MQESNNNQLNNEFYHELGKSWYEAEDHPVALLRQESFLKANWVLESVSSQSCVLDVGCGAGLVLNQLSQKGFQNLHGIDLSEESLQIARNYDPQKRVQYQMGDAKNLPYPNGKFDAVLCFDFLEHVEDPETVVAEIARVLRPGGFAFFHTFNRTWLADLIVIRAVEKFVPNTPEHMHVIDLFVKPSELLSYSEKSGLDLVEWRGLRPKIMQKSWWTLLREKRVDSKFSFVWTKNLSLGYAMKAVRNSFQHTDQSQ